MDNFLQSHLARKSTEELEAILRSILDSGNYYDAEGIVIIILDILAHRDGADRYEIKRRMLRSATAFIRKRTGILKEK